MIIVVLFFACGTPKEQIVPLDVDAIGELKTVGDSVEVFWSFYCVDSTCSAIVSNPGDLCKRHGNKSSNKLKQFFKDGRSSRKTGN